MRQILTIIILLLSFCVIVPAQRRKAQSVLLDKTKPSVYLSFVRTAKLEPYYEGLSGETVWLRLHNNTRWAISLQASGVAEKEDGDASLYYDIVNENEIEITPNSYPCHVCSIIPLGSGKSLLFSIPREHLADERHIQIHFYFDWQDRDKNGEAESIVSFYGSDILGEKPK